MDLPASGFGPSGAIGAVVSTPAALSLQMSAALSGSWKNATIARASSSPMPCTSASSASDLAAMTSRLPNFAARSCATRSPTSRMPRALSRRARPRVREASIADRKSTRLNSSHLGISYAVFCLKKKKKKRGQYRISKEEKMFVRRLYANDDEDQDSEYQAVANVRWRVLMRTDSCRQDSDDGTSK